jgi:hypothetical protein
MEVLLMGRRRGRSKPSDSITLTTYAELDAYFYAFGQGALTLLVVISAAGLQKSRTMRAAVGDGVARISGHNSPLGLFRDAWYNRDCDLVLDDVDGLSGVGVHLLKSLCQTDLVKTLTWNTASQILAAEGIPRRFTTRSRVAIIANDWESINAHVAALTDRGHLVFFEPTPLETHLRTAEWFWDQETFNFIGERLHLFKDLSMRLYVKAFEAKTAGLDWQREVLSRCLTGPALLVARLKADPKFASEEERVKAFIGQGGGCRATYFNHAKELAPPCDPPRVELKNTAPPREDRAMGLGVLELLRARYRRVGDG